MKRKFFKTIRLLVALGATLCLLSACGAANNADSAAIEGGEQMTDIKITVKDKKATPIGAPVIVCGNSDYTATFDFDDEWSQTGVRTARFVYVKDGKVQHEDVPFSGNNVAVPILSDVDSVNVGVFAGELRTTTPARINCQRSILCGSGTVHEPTPDVYDQIMALFNEMAEQGAFGATEEQARQIEQNRQNIDQLAAEKADQVDVDALEAQVSQHTQSLSQLSTEKAKQTDVDVLAARMDTFTKLAEGSTTGDAELADARVGADGTVYETAGEAVRAQVGDLKSDLSKVLIVGTNMVDYSNLETGYYINETTGVPTANANHCMIQWTPVKANTAYVIGLYDAEYDTYGNYVINKGVRISFYNVDKTWISAFICDSTGKNVFTTPSDTAFISISWNCSSGTLYPMLATGNTLPPYEDYTKAVNMEIVDAYTKEEIDAMISEENYRLYTTVNGSMTDGTILAISENNVQKKNIELVFAADIATFESITVGMRHAYSGTLWNRITVDNQNIVAYDIGNADGVTYPHGLSIDNNIQVHIHKNYDLTADVTLVSNGNRFTQTISWHDFTQLVQPYAVSNDSTLTDCVFTMQLSDASKDIWAFGDSYFNYSPSRWMYYADEAGLTDKMMLDAHPGENSVSAIMALETALLHGKPKFILWCMGMNDLSDSTDAPSKQWLTNLEVFLEKCEDNDITPILATIPSVPSVNNEMKNAWVRASGYRYIDFAKAVGATSSGAWYGDMLSSDNLHPSESGAKALYMRAIADFPELLIK